MIAKTRNTSLSLKATAVAAIVPPKTIIILDVFQNSNIEIPPLDASRYIDVITNAVPKTNPKIVAKSICTPF